EPINDNEQEYLNEMQLANDRAEDAAIIDIIAQALSAIPTFSFKLPVPKPESFSVGAANLAAIAHAIGRSYSYLITSHTHSAARASTLGAHKRREEEWALQAELARRELIQLDRQIAAAELRVAIVEKDLAAHDLQIENARSVDELLRNKFAN